jgi:hypothetical protein
MKLSLQEAPKVIFLWDCSVYMCGVDMNALRWI